MNHFQFGQLLKEAFHNQSAITRRVQLPSEERFRVSGDIETAALWLSADATEANMQDDAAAFEGWALVLMAWCGVQRVTIDWDEPPASSGHHQRFLYRVDRFAEMLGPDIVTVKDATRLAGSKMRGGYAPMLNLASGSDSLTRPSRPGSEADLEKRLAGADPAARANLMDELGLVLLDRQMPVGVFDGVPSRDGAIFTGGKSAIDLVGIGADGSLWLLELKTARNIKVGALSELFFYSMVVLDAQAGKIQFHGGRVGARTTVTPQHVIGAARIHARVLSEDCHPLLSTKVFSLATDAARCRGWSVDFGYHDLRNCLAAVA